MDKKVEFFFYMAAVICFGLAATGEGVRLGRVGRRTISLVPLGLLLWLFPLMWNTGRAAF